MIWNYRIVRYRKRKGYGQDYGLHEVYYDDDGEPWGMTKRRVAFSSGDEQGPEELIKDLSMALEDAQRLPVLDEPKRWPGRAPGDDEVV